VRKDLHDNIGRYLETEGMAPGDVELVPLQALPALNDAAWWHAQKLIKARLAEKDIVDESFLREALRDLK
jgi:hypothetical protein